MRFLWLVRRCQPAIPATLAPRQDRLHRVMAKLVAERAAYTVASRAPGRSGWLLLFRHAAALRRYRRVVCDLMIVASSRGVSTNCDDSHAPSPIGFRANAAAISAKKERLDVRTLMRRVAPHAACDRITPAPFPPGTPRRTSLNPSAHGCRPQGTSRSTGPGS